MTTAGLLADLRRLGVVLWAEGDRLRFNAPAGVLTPDFRAQLAERKAEILGLLRGKPGRASGAAAAAPRGQQILPAGRDRELPLSYPQRRLWFLSQLEPESPFYNYTSTIRLTGPLDVSVLERSLCEVVRRHEALRTTFEQAGGEPRQVVAPELRLPFPVTDLSGLGEAERSERARRAASEEARRPFDLARGPLLRVRLLRLAEEEHEFLLTIHHIIADGWSIGVFAREMALLYAAFFRGEPSPLEELPVQYADYAVWQRERLGEEVLTADLDYWKRRLAGAPALLELPTDRPRPAVQSFRGAHHSFFVPEALYQSLKALSRREGATLFMTLLAGFKTLLYRYTNVEDIVVGTDMASRNLRELEGLVGFFINTLALRTDLSGDPTFRELLARVRETTLGAYAHQSLPFDRLVEALEPERSAAHMPVFQVLFVLQNAPMPAVSLAGLKLSLLEFDDGTSKFDIVLSMSEAGGGLSGNVVYSTDLFDAGTIARMSEHFRTLLGSIAADPDARLRQLEMLTETEKERQDAARRERQDLHRRGLRGARRQAVALTPQGLVVEEPPAGGPTRPLVIRPRLEHVDLPAWAGANREYLESRLLAHGAVLFRGFGVASPAEFEGVAAAVCGELFGEYGDLPREEVRGKVYVSTPYPPDRPILLHNESSQLHRWPMKIWFYCARPAASGGETPVADCREVYRLLDPRVRERLARQGVMYVRNYTEKLDVSWQDFFRTGERAEVERLCRAWGLGFEWKADGGLRTRMVCPAVARHPKTGEAVAFNQMQAHHVSCLEPAVRASLLSLFRPEDLPRNVYYGDGGVIEDGVMDEMREAYRRATVSFPWQEGDVLMVDNMLVAHGRNPYTGPRKIMVTMGEMFCVDDLPPEVVPFRRAAALPA